MELSNLPPGCTEADIDAYWGDEIERGDGQDEFVRDKR